MIPIYGGAESCFLPLLRRPLHIEAKEFNL